jgi:ribose 5-phosphate isomerase A
MELPPASWPCVNPLSEQDTQKRAAAERALEQVENGMLLGVGSGTTARFFIEGLAARAAEGLRVTAVPTSEASSQMLVAAGIPVVEDVDRSLDLAIDGADEVDPELNALKGHGGALFREKLVAVSAARFLVIVDETKLVERLGQTFVPVEVLPFMWRQTAGRVAPLCTSWALRGGTDQPYRTDNGNLILDLNFEGGISDLEATASALKEVTGVVEHGLFLGVATACLVAGAGGVRELRRTT